jgi:hypothetical protein
MKMRGVINGYVVYGYRNSRLFQKKFIFIAKNKYTQFSTINVYMFPSTTNIVPYVDVKQRMKPRPTVFVSVKLWLYSDMCI